MHTTRSRYRIMYAMLRKFPGALLFANMVMLVIAIVALTGDITEFIPGILHPLDPVARFIAIPAAAALIFVAYFMLRHAVIYRYALHILSGHYRMFKKTATDKAEKPMGDGKTDHIW